MDQNLQFSSSQRRLIAELRRWTPAALSCLRVSVPSRPERASERASPRLPALPLSDDRVISQRWRRGLVPSAGPPMARLLNVIADTVAATRHPSPGRHRRRRPLLHVC